MRGQATMIDILLLGLFISIVLVAGFVFMGSEELRAQHGREEAVYAQAQLVDALNYRQSGWGNITASQMIITKFCNSSIVTVVGNCTSSDSFYVDMQKLLNRTARTGYNYIFYAETSGGQTFTVCNLQPTACAKSVPAIATVEMTALCPSNNYIAIKYLHGIWPDWMVLPLACED